MRRELWLLKNTQYNNVVFCVREMQCTEDDMQMS